MARASTPRPRKAAAKKALPPLPPDAPQGVQTVPVLLDENDGLVAVVPPVKVGPVKMPPTPTDPGFRRGIYVMLLVLGVLAASSLIQSRTNQADLAEARKAQAAAERTAEERGRQLADLLAGQKAMSEESVRFRNLLIAILARSDDPALRDEFEKLAREQGIDTEDPFATPTRGGDAGPSPSPRRQRAEDRPQSAPRPEPRPSRSPRPQPSPEPSEPPPPPRPVPTIVPQVCATALGQRICTP